MKTYIALFRGINVGGRNILRMADLVALLKKLGASRVETYIQSGNVVLQHEEEDPSQLARRIEEAIQASHGFEPQVLLRDALEVENAMASNPFPEAESEPKSLHLFFLESPPQNPDLDALDAIKESDERFDLIDAVFYLHTPSGIGRSKLAARAEKALGVAATGRNWRTVGKIVEMVNRWSRK
jgi:uncharacterized protein (DUF1697 family)